MQKPLVARVAPMLALSLLTVAAGAAASSQCAVGPSRAIANAVPGAASRSAKDAEAPGLVNFDRFLTETRSTLSAVPAGFDGRWQSAIYDRHLGTPTFLWARTDAPVAAVGALRDRELLIARARAHLYDEAGVLGLTRAAIDQAQAFDAQYNGNGPAVVRFRQNVQGLEVFGRTLNVLLDRANKPIAVSGYFAPGDDATVAAPTFSRSARQAIAAAWGNLGGALSATSLVRTAARSGWQLFSTPTLAGNYQFERAPRARALWYARAGGLEPAWQVEIFARESRQRGLIAYSFIVSARDGSVLHRDNLKANLTAYTYRVYADDQLPLHQPFDSPLGNGYTPFPGVNPTDDIARVGTQSNRVTLANAGIVTNDPWLPDNATTTIGNHVDACIDSFDNPADGILSTPLNTCDPALGDTRAAPNGPNTFDYAVAADSDPSTAEARNAAVVNLFYMNNWLHDWWYNHGFDEASGNAQTDNFGRGGAQGDPIKAQGQDGSGRNNANMSTPADGSSPTMQQYLFDGPIIGEVRQTAPVAGGPLKFSAGSFGPDSYDLTQALVVPNDGQGASMTDGCGPDDPTGLGFVNVPGVPDASLAGKIALIDRGNCNFTTKSQYAMLSGAVAVVVVNNNDGEPIPMGNGDIPVDAAPVSPTDPLYQLPAVMIRKADGERLKAQLAGGAVTLHLQRSPSIDTDGTLDNQIIAHEYFHYVHHRLTNSSSTQSDGMSEGWGDIDAFMLSVRPDDTLVPGNEAWAGAYGLAGYAANNFFAGIRRAPYSTDFARNAFTFKHIADGTPTPDGADGASNSEVHNTGEIWANMMWECYAGILKDPRHTFLEARSRMQDYIIAGFKMTPTDATFTEARDAVLAAAMATDFQDYAECSGGFAHRGIGIDAVAPARSSSDNTGVVEDYNPFVCPLPPFTFPGRSGVATGITQVSDAIVPSGPFTLPISISHGRYSIDGGPFTAQPGVIASGQSVRVQHTTATTANAQTVTTLTVGDASGTFTTTTGALDSSPDAFRFPARFQVNPQTLVASKPVTPTGFNVPVSVAAFDGAQYSIDGAAFTSRRGTLQPGQSLRVRHTSAVAGGEKVSYLRIGTTKATFRSVTAQP